MGLQLVTPASDLLVTLEEAKLACRIDETIGATEDAWLTRKIKSATSQIEAFICRPVLDQAWLLTLDEFSDTIPLSHGPVQDVVWVKYDDANGVEQTLLTSTYVLDLVSDPPKIVRDVDASWPVLAERPNAVRIQFEAGFADTSPALERIKDVCLDVLSYWYDARGQADFPKWAEDRLFDLRPFMI